MSTLRREIGLPGAILLGLGSMIGTGVFVSIGLAAGIAGIGLLWAIALAALLALANALSSAQLAAAHPVSGGTYAYGLRYLTPSLGFAAGWTFLCAKSASAATASIGAASYLLALLARVGAIDSGSSRLVTVVIALASVAIISGLVAGGIRRSNAANAFIVSVTLVALAALVIASFMWASRAQAIEPLRARIAGPSESFGAPSWSALLEATALMFVAFTGYGRLATLGEEVRDPRRVIPAAIGVTMALVTLLYLAVAVSALLALPPEVLGREAQAGSAPLGAVAHAIGTKWLELLLAIGAVTAMLGVLLNLLLGLSRVVLAMARHGDAPIGLACVSETRASPIAAVIVCGVAVAALAAIGDVKLSWSLSAFTVLLYYAITNLAALRLPREDRRFPRVIALCGLVACLSLAFWVEWRAWAIGIALLGVGFALRALLRFATRR